MRGFFIEFCSDSAVIVCIAMPPLGHLSPACHLLMVIGDEPTACTPTDGMLQSMVELQMIEFEIIRKAFIVCASSAK